MQSSDSENSNNDENIEIFLQKDEIYQKNEKFKKNLEKMIIFSNLPILSQIQETTISFFELSHKNSDRNNRIILNLISQLFLKLKCLDYLNLLITYFKFIEKIKSEEIEKDYINNNIGFLSKNDMIISPIQISLEGFSLQLTSTTKEKFDYFASFIEKEVTINYNNKCFTFDLSYGSFPHGHILQITQRNTYLNVQDINYNFKQFSNQKQAENFDGDQIKSNLVICEKIIKKNFILTKRNTSKFHQTYQRFKEFIFSKEKLSPYIRAIYPFGSVTQCTQNITSDLEITIITNNYQILSGEDREKILKDIESVLNEDTDHYQKVTYRSTKRTQLIDFEDKETEIKIELNLNNFFGICNSHLIRNYLVFDSRALILVNTIKDWSKRKGINGNFNGFLSSYCYTLMTIYFLQRIENPILPILFSKNDLTEINIENKQYYLEKKLIDVSMGNFKSTNTDSCITLFLKWLIFYLYLFNERDYCIDISSEKVVFRYDEINYLNYFNKQNKKCAYCIIDMFDYTYNPGAYLERESTPHLMMKRVMEKTMNQILTGNEKMLENDSAENNMNN